MIVGYCILNGKKWVMFEDKQCSSWRSKVDRWIQGKADPLEQR